MAKDYSKANKGRGLEQVVELSNRVYERRGEALVHKVATPVTVVRKGKQIVSAFYNEKSTLDFKGVLKGGQSIAFDCKECADQRGLLLSHIKEHQVDYIRKALELGEKAFLITYITPRDEYYFVNGQVVIDYWDRWKANPRKRGYNYISVEDMKKLKSNEGVAIDYLIELERR